MPGFAREPPQGRRGRARGPLAARRWCRSCRCRSSAGERSGLFKKPPCRRLSPAAKCGRSRALRRSPSVTRRLGEMPPRGDWQQEQLYANGAGGSAGALSTRAAASPPAPRNAPCLAQSNCCFLGGDVVTRKIISCTVSVWDCVRELGDVSELVTPAKLGNF